MEPKMFGGGGGEETLHHFILPPYHYLDPLPMSEEEDFPKRDERVPQWSQQETRDFISIRAELETDFTTTKRNKTLWEIVAAKMNERGYRRTPDQCKCKWKNLVSRYKGKETSNPENCLQCPFFEELQALFTQRENKVQQQLQMESEPGSSQAKRKFNKVTSIKINQNQSSEEEISQDEYENNGISTSQKKLKQEKQIQKQVSCSKNDISVKDMLRNFIEQQERIELEWRDIMEKRAQERRVFEDEWRRSMERLERERLMIERDFREREEQRRIREESRTEKRDKLLTTLLNKLIHEN